MGVLGGCGSTQTSTIPPIQQIVFSPRIPISAVSLSHPHFLPLPLPFFLVPLPKGGVFSLSLCTPHPLMPCLALPWPLPPSSQEWLCLLICPTTSPLPCSRFFWKAPQPNPAPAKVTGPPASSGTPWARAGGAWSPHHTHTHRLAAKPIYTSPRGCQWRNVRTHSKAANRAAGGSPPSPAERQELGLSASLHPVPHCREWEHTSGIWPRLVSPLLLQVNSARKTLE